MENAQQNENSTATDTLHFPPTACPSSRVTAQFPKGTRIITMTGILPVEMLKVGQIVIGVDGTQRKILAVRSGVAQKAIVTTRPLAAELRRTRFPGQHDRCLPAPTRLYELTLDVVSKVPSCRPKAVTPSTPHPQSDQDWDPVRNIFAA